MPRIVPVCTSPSPMKFRVIIADKSKPLCWGWMRVGKANGFSLQYSGLETQRQSILQEKFNIKKIKEVRIELRMNRSVPDFLNKWCCCMCVLPCVCACVCVCVAGEWRASPWRKPSRSSRRAAPGLARRRSSTKTSTWPSTTQVRARKHTHTHTLTHIHKLGSCIKLQVTSCWLE